MEHDKVHESYASSIIRINQILEELDQSEEENKKKYLDFLESTGKLIITLCKLEEELS